MKNTMAPLDALNAALEVAVLTDVVREADAAFMKSGGSSRHWVRDEFLPRLRDRAARFAAGEE